MRPIIVEAMFETPILFVIFNRPDVTARVFAEIRKVRPRQLFVAADGPRLHKPGEREACEQARAIVSQIDWPCELHTKFNEQNLGCRSAVSGAISWFFEQVEQGIILEDDCLPAPGFFSFCEELLHRYGPSPRIMMISGDNFQFGKKWGNASYYFTRHADIWGWATWRRAWRKADIGMKDFPRFERGKKIREIFSNQEIQSFMLEKFRDCYAGGNSWALPWSYSMMKEDGLSICPNVNLVSNIGYSEAATHSTNLVSPLANLPAGEIGQIVHPEKIEPNLQADEFEGSFFLKEEAEQKTSIQKIRRFVKCRLKEIGLWKR